MSTTSSDSQTASAAEVARAYLEAIGRHERDAQMRFYTPGAVGQIQGVLDSGSREQVRDFFGELYDAFPDFSLEVLDVVGDADKAVVRWRARGTFSGSGSFLGMRPTGRAIDLEGMDMIWVRDGRVERVEAYMDGMTMARQLGAMPPKDSPPERVMTAALNSVTRVREAIAKRRSGAG
jgi:steroid delta-isomerase-like uncharacterized protein